MFARLFHFLVGYKCTLCGGLGRIVLFNADVSGCPNCNGSGRIRRYSTEIIETPRYVNHRALKLMRQGKPFIVIATDAPYFLTAYGLLRNAELLKGDWTEEDEYRWLSAINQNSKDDA